MLDCQRSLFDLPDDVRYLNCAYMAPQLKSVTEVGLRSVASKSRPWNVGPEDFFRDSERARALFSSLIDASADDIALVPSVSYALATAASILPLAQGQNIVVLAEQFPSNVYVWREKTRRFGGEMRTVQRPSEGAWTAEVLDAIDEKTAIVAVPNVHWTDGSLVDLEAVSARAREVGSALVIDATQSLGALPLSVANLEPDFLACASYKWLLGPYSTGFLHVHPRWHDAPPLEHNWQNRANSEDFAGLVDYRDGFQPGARRFDVGERSNFALMPMVVEALEQLTRWGVDAIAHTLQEKTDRIALRAREEGLDVAPSDARGPHMLGVRFPDGAPAGVLEALRTRNVHVSQRGDSIRISPHLYNDDSDTAALFDALRQFQR